ncbi:MAG TPA: TolC family protein [Gemmatimonadaceae bacterium]|nr:TolC family protein [Gemmatimonadaceae bacterium]
MSRTHTRGVTVAGLGALVALTAAVSRPLGAQQDTLRQQPVSTARRLSLVDALKAAEGQSETVQIARAGLTRAEGQKYQARSQYLPQLSLVGVYQRTLNSQFQGLFSAPKDTSTAPKPQAVCAPTIKAGASQSDIDAALAQASTCQAAGGINFQQAGFGAPNQWTFGLSFTQNVFAGGRISGQYQAANASVSAASIEVSAQRAQLALDVTQAYYDAALADRLVNIQTSALGQTEEILRQTRVAKQVGNQAEFDLLRAQVTRDNQVPVVLQAQNTRQVAYYRLKQLLNLPMDGDVVLTTPLDDSTMTASTVTAAVNAGSSRVGATGAAVAMVPDTNVSDRAPVRQLEQSVRAQEGLLKVARGERLPSLQITSGYQRLYFPTNVLFQINDARINWTVGVTASLPILTGGRIKGDVLVAQANLDQARAQLQQTREVAALDARVALSALQQAEASWQASAGTAQQAARAYNIDQIRYREGISTQTDLAQSRILLEQSLANRAQAARDLAVARVKLALLRDLPLQTGAAAQAQAQSQTQAGSAVNGNAPGSQSGGATQQTPTRTQTQAAASASGVSGGGITP